MRRIRNLALFGIGVLALTVGLLWTFRVQLMPFLGVNFDIGPGGRAELQLPEGYAATVFAEGLANPRFMAVSPDGVLFVAERGADRIVALPDDDGDGHADRTVEVGRGFGNAHDIEFDGRIVLLVAGETTLFRVGLDPDDYRALARLPFVENLPPGGHSTKTVEVLPSGELLLSIGSSCDVCNEVDPRRASVQLVSESGEMRPAGV
jgi:glucose/arabinose dehydrogenase